MVRRKTRERQEELVDAALRIIETQGIAALTTRALADEIGLTTGAIFRHFTSLDALLLAVVTRVEQVLAQTFPPEHLEPRERLLQFVERRSEVVGTQRGILRLMLSEQFALALPAEGAERIRGCVKRSRAFIAACIREAQAAGTLRSDVDAQALALVVIGTTQALALAHTAPFAVANKTGHALIREGLGRLLAPDVEAARRAPRGRRPV